MCRPSIMRKESRMKYSQRRENSLHWGPSSSSSFLFRYQKSVKFKLYEVCYLRICIQLKKKGKKGELLFIVLRRIWTLAHLRDHQVKSFTFSRGFSKDSKIKEIWFINRESLCPPSNCNCLLIVLLLQGLQGPFNPFAESQLATWTLLRVVEDYSKAVWIISRTQKRFKKQ